MSSSEFDLPVKPSADQIRRREFATVRRGYDPDQVREYMKALGDQVEALEVQVNTTRMEVEAAAQGRPGGDPFEALGGRIAEILRTAEQHSGEREQEAENEARKLVSEARMEADRVRLDAQSKAEAVRQQADDTTKKSKKEAERLLSSAMSHRKGLLAELESMRENLLEMANNLDTVTSAAPATGGTTADPFTDPQFAELWSTTPAAPATGGSASPAPAADKPHAQERKKPEPAKAPQPSKAPEPAKAPGPAKTSAPAPGPADMPDIPPLDMGKSEDKKK
ncbi:MAG: DivIVA domain-containing protein [Actinomycetota bacterium]